MTDPGRAYDRLRAANPAPTTPVLDRPDAAAFLASLDTRPPVVAAPPPRRQPRRPALVAAAAAFAITLLLGFGWLAGRLTPEPDVAEPTTTTEAPETTTTTVTTTTPPPPTTGPAVIDPASQALLDRFEATYNAGDADAFLALFQPGLNREVIVDSDRRLYPPELMRDLYLVETALHTEIRLECTTTQDLFACVPFRYDDLHRILGLEPTAGPAWNLRFDEDGLVRGWNERRQNIIDVDDYEREAVKPFMTWVRENHPEVGELSPAVAADWIVSKRDDIVAMVAAFAESRGVTLEE